ncbi:hypothetical protein [Flavobacterium sp. H122]|uniref:hypothetical protein n=1 Tax=Flavobacterium sp. H122 TaxID=2529860 RepID=UPI0010AA7F25|nr:hypothetical protein [Flavobacterium sp. H122]
MNKIYFLIISIACVNSISAQSKFKGIVLSEGIPLADVEIVNVPKKNAVKSNDRGEFQIQVEVNDEIVFFLKNYLQKNEKIKMEHLAVHNNVVLKRRPIELDEVKIVKAPKVYVINDYESLKMAKIEKDQSRPKVIGVYTGEFQNGIDFMAVGNKIASLIGKIFKKNEDIQKRKIKTSFEDYINISFGNEYLVQKLNLPENEFDLFIRFCKNDNLVATVVSKDNKLEALEFLLKKRREFKPDK